jgi:hypothetical protein
MDSGSARQQARKVPARSRMPAKWGREPSVHLAETAVEMAESLIARDESLIDGRCAYNPQSPT